MSAGITKKEIVEKLEAINSSARVLGNEGLAVDISDLIEEIKKDL